VFTARRFRVVARAATGWKSIAYARARFAALACLGLHQAAGGGDAVRRCVPITLPQRPDGQLLE